MGTVQFTCPNCQQTSQVDESAVGLPVLCPTCGLMVTVAIEASPPPLPAGKASPGTAGSSAAAVPRPPAPPVVQVPTDKPRKSGASMATPHVTDELHRMSRTEKIRRRQRMNLIMLFVGLGILVVVLITLVNLSG